MSPTSDPYFVYIAALKHELDIFITDTSKMEHGNIAMLLSKIQNVVRGVGFCQDLMYNKTNPDYQFDRVAAKRVLLQMPDDQPISIRDVESKPFSIGEHYKKEITEPIDIRVTTDKVDGSLLDDFYELTLLIMKKQIVVKNEVWQLAPEATVQSACVYVHDAWALAKFWDMSGKFDEGEYEKRSKKAQCKFFQDLSTDEKAKDVISLFSILHALNALNLRRDEVGEQLDLIRGLLTAVKKGGRRVKAATIKAALKAKVKASWQRTSQKVMVTKGRGKSAKQVEKTLYRNSATGELRVRRIVERKGTRVAVYAKV